MEEDSYLKTSWKIFLGSFKEFNQKSVFIVLYDLIFYFIVMMSLFIFRTPLKDALVKLNLLDINKAAESPELASSIYSEMKGILLTIILSILIMLIIIFLAMCILKIMIWFKAAGKTFEIRDIIRFALTRLVWLLISIAVIALLTPILITIGVFVKMKMLSLSIIMSLFAGIIFLFFANIKNLMYIYFTETKDLSCIKKAFRLGFKKVHLFIIPYLTIIASFLVFYNIYLYIFAFLFGGMAPLESAGFSLKTFFFYLIAPLIMFGLWFRIYLYSIFKSLEH